MSNILKVVGLDPSMSNFGIVKADLDVDSLAFTITDVILLETEPEKDKKVRKVVRKNSEDLDRARILYNGLQEHAKGAWIGFAEIPVGSQSSRAMASYGMCLGVLASCPIPLIQVTPTEVKVAGAGTKTATKEEMIEWAVAKHPEAGWLRQMRSSPGRVKMDKKTGKPVLEGGQQVIVGAYKKGDPTGDNEHLADATAAIYAGLATDQFLQVLAMLKGTPMFSRAFTPA